VGFVRIENERLDAIAEGEVIELGQRVEVVDAYDNQLKVRHVSDRD
jgi:membrane-bound ClpP family serine protease